MMLRQLPWVFASAVLIMAGCATTSRDGKLLEAMGLVEQRLGERPAWTAPWDNESPLWDGDSVLRAPEAVALALRNNRELRADLEMIAQADAELLQAGLLQNPVINFMIMFPDGGGRSMLRGNGLPMQPLQDLWMIPARKRVAQSALQETVLRVADRAVETAANVKKLYARLQYTQRAIELVRENMQIVEQSTGIIRARQAAGQATQVTVTLSEIRYLQLKSDLRRMEAEHRAAQRQLLMLMGIAGATDRWKVESIAELKDPVASTGDEEQLLLWAADQRLDLKAAEWRVRSAESNIMLAHRMGWPDLSLGLGFERGPAGQSNNAKWIGKAGNTAARGLVDRATGMPSPIMLPQPFEPKMREPKYTIGPMLEMEIPIFDWNQAGIARAVSEYRQRRAEYEARCQEVTRMVRETLVMLQQSYDQVVFYREALMPSVQRNLEVARQTFVGGQESLTIYLEVQENLLMTRQKALEFLRDYLVNRAELERQAGGLLPASIPSTQPAPVTQPG